MKIIYFILGIYIKIVAFFNVSKAASIAFSLFQKTQPKKLSEKERNFYDQVNSFELDTEVEKVTIYELGAENDKLAFLVHGWNANAGSMGTIAKQLSLNGFHCILFDLPGHQHSSLNYSNLKLCKLVLQHVLKRVRQEKPIYLIAHSFGSAVSAYALSELNIHVDRLVYLTCPNTLSELFEVLKKRLSLPSKVYKEVIYYAEDLLGESIDEITVLKKTALINYSRLLLLHDVYDKVLPIEYSELLHKGLKDSELINYEKIGHYRMLNHQILINDLINNISTPIVKAEQIVTL